DFRFATEEEIRAVFNCPPGFLGPVGLDRAKIKVIADRTVAAMSDFVCGANKPKFHTAGVNWGRDLPEPDVVADIRNVLAGDPSPDGKGTLELCRGIEVGHIFQLGRKYSEAMQATYLDENGQHQVMTMGCYGIGVSRIVGAAIEQGFDAKGIVFPTSIAPFQVAIVAIGFERSEEVRQAAIALHDQLQACGVDVLLDDRGERPGVMFADMELIGIPHRITVGDRGLKEGMVEYQARTGGEVRTVALSEAASFIKAVCAG
ncbi:MAG TPA: His/Gly/Thr/Pro-type tRNA ligase C-terminal domain-containing protein, partial [Methylophilaceae bacterium]